MRPEDSILLGSCVIKGEGGKRSEKGTEAAQVLLDFGAVTGSKDEFSFHNAAQ